VSSTGYIPVTVALSSILLRALSPTLHMFIFMICCPYYVLKVNYKYKHSDGSPVLGCELNAYWQGRASTFSTSTPGIFPEPTQVVFSVYQNRFPWI
jgi:hypothetical protein